MKLLSFRLTAALLAAVLGVTSLAIAVEDAPETKTSEEGASAPAEATKKSTSKKPRGILADSFLWTGGQKTAGKDGSTLPGVATAQQPTAERGILAPVVTAAAAEQVRKGGPRSEPVLNTPAPPIVEAPSPLTPPSAASYDPPAPPVYYQTTSAPPVQQPAAPVYYQTTSAPPVQQPAAPFAQQPAAPFVQQPGPAPFVQQPGAPFVQPAPAPFVQQAPAPFAQLASAPFIRTASWSMNGGPEVQTVEPPTISSNVSCSCSDDSSCTSCNCCPDPLWCHRATVFFDLLYLRPGNIDYVYAVEQTGPLSTDVPTGHTGRVGFDAAPGYRVGAALPMNDCSSIQFAYTLFNADTGSVLTANPGNVLVFQPGLPQIPNVGATAIQASASQAIRFQLLELDYRSLLYGTCDTAVNYFAGVRYANLDQTFHGREDVGVPVGLSRVDTKINFDGFGIGMGMDAMKRQAATGLLIYGRWSASFVSGEFKAQYRETTQFGPNSVIGNNITDYRVMSILQTELGLGWRSYCGRYQVLTGYTFQSWGNALTTASYIPGVQNRRFDNLNETLTFDGFTSRVQYNW